MDAYDYVHIYSLDNSNAQFVESVGTTSPSSLVGIRAKGAGVEQILLKHRTPGDSGWTALSDRTNLLELSGRYKKVRVSDDDLVLTRRNYGIREIEIVWGKNQVPPHPNRWVWVERYNIEKNYLAYLYLTGKRKLTGGKPTDAYIDQSNKIQLMAQDQWSETLTSVEDRFLGPITDFQLSRKLLYVVNAKGFLSIIDLNPETKHRFISATNFQDQYPVSIAVGENYVCVLTAPEDLQR